MQPLTLYFDRNVGKRLPEGLKLLQLPGVKDVVHHHTERRLLGMRSTTRGQHLFKHDEPDDQWLAFVGTKGWIVFSQDRKFHQSGYENELAAIKQFNVGCFYLWGSCARTSDKALCLLRAFPRVLAAIEHTPKPFIFDIDVQSKVRRVPLP